MADIVDVRRIPVIGSKLYRVGQVQEIITQPCSPDPSITVKAFFANVPMLIWSFVKPDPIDYVQDRFGSAHHRKRKGNFTIDDIDVAPPSGGKGYLRWVSFTGNKLAQRVGFYFCVVDATTNFLINWTSMAYRFSGCQDPTSGYATTTRDTHNQGFINVAGGSFQPGGGTPAASPGFQATNANVTMISPGPHAISGGIEFEPDPTQPNGQVTRVELVASGGGLSNEDITVTDSPDPSYRSSGFARQIYTAPISSFTYSLRVYGTVGFIGYKSFRLSLSGWPQHPPGIAPDP